MVEGKFIVIDGTTNGAGKGTQAKILVRKLEEQGYTVKLADFPQYGTPPAFFVEKYLRGEYGGLEDVGPYMASHFYALDRFDASFKIKKWLKEGFIVISNRYVSSNKGHQLGKINDNDEKTNFLNWINDLEYKKFGIPIPDLTVLLHMSPEIGQKLVCKKAPRDYLKGEKMDIEEKSLEHGHCAEKAYLFCFDNDNVENWQKVLCFADDNPRSIEDINQDVLSLVKEVL